MRCKDGKILWAVVVFLFLLAIPVYATDPQDSQVSMNCLFSFTSPVRGVIDFPIHVKNKDYTSIGGQVDDLVIYIDDKKANSKSIELGPSSESDFSIPLTTFLYQNGVHNIKINVTYTNFASGFIEQSSCEKTVEFNNENIIPSDWEPIKIHGEIPHYGDFITLERFFAEDRNNEIFDDLIREGYINMEGDSVESHRIETVYRDYLGFFDNAIIPAIKSLSDWYGGSGEILKGDYGGTLGNLKDSADMTNSIYQVSKGASVAKETSKAAKGFVIDTVATFILGSVVDYYAKDVNYWNVRNLEPSDDKGNHYVVYVTVNHAIPDELKFENVRESILGYPCYKLFETRLYHLNKNGIWEYNNSKFYFSANLLCYGIDYKNYVEPVSTPSIVEPGKKVVWKYKVKKVLPTSGAEKVSYENQLYENSMGLMYLYIRPPRLICGEVQPPLCNSMPYAYVSNVNVTINYYDGRVQEFDSSAVLACLPLIIEEKCLLLEQIPPTNEYGFIQVPSIAHADIDVNVEFTGLSNSFNPYSVALYDNNKVMYGLTYFKYFVSDLCVGLTCLDPIRIKFSRDEKSNFAKSELNVINSVDRKDLDEKNLKILPWKASCDSNSKNGGYNVVLRSFMDFEHFFVLLNDKYVGSMRSIYGNIEYCDIPELISGNFLSPNLYECIFGKHNFWFSFKTCELNNITLISEHDSSYYQSVYSKEIDEFELNMKNIKEEDFEGYVTDGSVKVGMLSDGTYQVNVTNNQLIFNVLDNNLHVFIFSKYKNDWQDTFSVPFLQTKTLKIDYGPDLIITETYDGRAWKYIPVLPSYDGKECTSNDQCVSNNCAACSGQTAHCCPTGQSWTGFVCSNSCQCTYDTDCDACQKCENNKCINSSSDSSGKCGDGCCEAGKCYSKGACSPRTISKCGESNKWFVPNCGDGICECGETSLSCSADCVKKDNGVKCSLDGECSSGNCAPAAEPGGYSYCCAQGEVWDGYKCTQNNYCTLDADCESCQKCQEETCVADNHDPSGKCGNGCCEAGMCYPSGYVSQIFTERCENKVWFSLCPSTNCMKDYDGNERPCKECSASDVKNGYCNEVSISGTAQKCYYGDPDTNYMHDLCDLSSDCDGTPTKTASTCSEIVTTGYLSCEYLGFRCNCADTCDGNLRVYQPLRACLAGETCYEVGGCLYKYCSPCGTDACAGGQCTAVPNDAVCKDTQCLPGYSPIYDTWSRPLQSSTCFTLLPKGTCTKCDSGLAYYTTEYIDSCEKTSTAFYYSTGYESKSPSKISEGLWNPKLSSDEETWLSGIKCTSWNSVDKCTQCSDEKESDYEVRADCTSPIPSTYLLCGDSGSMKCYDPSTYECCAGDTLVKRDQDTDGITDHQCCIDKVSSRVCEGGMPSGEKPVLSYASKDIMFDESNCGGCGKICKKSSLGACIEFGYSTNNICSGENPQCCGGTCGLPKPDLEISGLNLYPVNLIEGASEMLLITVKRNDEFDSQNIATDNVKVKAYVDGQEKGEGFVNLQQSSTADLIIGWKIETPGNHVIMIVVDPDNEVSECKKSNNVLVMNVSVSRKPDLTFNDYFNTFAWGNATTIGGDWETNGFSTDASGLAVSSSNKCGGTKYIRKRVEGPGKLSFMWKGQSSGTSVPNTGFFVDGVAVYQYATNFDWTTVNYNIPAGKHIIDWEIGYVTSGCSDDYISLWIDLVRPNILNTIIGLPSSGERMFFLNIPKNSETGKAVFDIGYEKETYQTTETLRAYCSKQCVTAGQRVSCDAVDVLKTIDPPGEGLYKFNITTPACSPNIGTTTYTITCTGGNAGTYNGCGQTLLINCTKIDIKADCWGANNCYGSTRYYASCDIGANPTVTYESLLPNNLSIVIKPDGNSTKEIWKNTGVLSEDFTIPDISADINGYLSKCTEINGYCKFPISIKSSSGGNLRIKNINVNYRSNSSFGSIPSLNSSCTSYAATCSSNNEKTYLLEGLVVVEPRKIIRQSSQVDTSSPFSTSVTSASFVYNLTCYKNGIAKKYDIFNLSNFTCTTSGCGSGTKSCYYTCQSNSISNLTLDCDRIVLYTYCSHSYTGQKRAGCSINTDTVINILPRSYMKIKNNGVETVTVADGDMVNLTSVLNNIGSTNTNNFINVLYVDGNPSGYEIVQMNGTESKEVSFNWTAFAGTHNLTIKADAVPSPEGLTPETAEANNEVSLIVKIRSLKVDLVSPIDGALIANNKPAFSFIVSGDQSAYSCQLLVDNVTYGRSDVVLANATSSITPNSTITEGNHNWQIECFDSAGSKRSDTRNTVIDTVPPSLIISSPQNTTYYTDKISMATSIQEAATCWYSLDNWATKTHYDCISAIFLAKRGTNIFSVEAVDAAGNSKKQNVSYTVDIYNKAITINEKSNKNLTNYQVKVNVGYQAQMKSDFSDIKFTDSDRATPMNYWIENYNSTNAIVWVKVPQIPANNTKIIYMYYGLHNFYGNVSINSKNDGNLAFEFFDDFKGTSLNLTKWSQNAVNNITHTINNSFRFEDATKSSNSYWIYSGGYTGSQHQAKWTLASSFAIDWESAVYDKISTEMGEGGVAIVDSGNRIIYYPNFADWCGGFLSLNARVIDISGTGYMQNLAGSECTANGNPTTASRKFTLIRNGINYETKINDVSIDTYNTTTSASKISLAAGAYGGYPYLDYVEISKLRIRKYTYPEPDAVIS